MKVNEEAYNILKAYQQLFDSPAGEMVLEDLRKSFSLDMSDGLSEVAADIPHPYRAYFFEGGRQVLRTILAAVEAAKQAELTYE